MSEIENALPSMFYGNLEECVDELRLLRKKMDTAAKRDRAHKSRRIQALVRNAMRNGGDKHGKR